MLLSILPIAAVFVLFQLLTHCYRRQLLRTGVGFLYTVIGLILFLTGVNVGFTPVGNLLGSGLAGSAYRWVLIPIGALIGYYIVKAEPAVQVLNKQVEDVTGGTVSQSMMNTALSIGVACAVMLSMVRVLTGISIYWILVPATRSPRRWRSRSWAFFTYTDPKPWRKTKLTCCPMTASSTWRTKRYDTFRKPTRTAHGAHHYEP